MSKQYLTTHTVDNAHTTSIFSLATTRAAVLSASGSSTIQIYRTSESPDAAKPVYSLVQSISAAHKLGCHHIATARGGTGNVAVSVGFQGEIKVWSCDSTKPVGEQWAEQFEITTQQCRKQDVGNVWAVALSRDEQYLACTTHDGKIQVWDLVAKNKIRTYEVGSGNSAKLFGLSIDLSGDGNLTASGHQNGGVYIFNNNTGRLQYSLSGLGKAVRAVAFSPGNTRLAAAGDAGVIALYDTKNGEHIRSLTTGSAGSGGSMAWITSLDWSDTGEYLLSGSMDGKARIWSVERGACVATHSETDSILWSVKWLPKTGRAEMFCTAGENKSITFYREATGQ